MPKKPQQLAKLSRPRLYDALLRERLFALLDQEVKHPVVWIGGPPGSRLPTDKVVPDNIQEAAPCGLEQVVDNAVLEGPGSMASTVIGREQPLAELSPRPPPESGGRQIGDAIAKHCLNTNPCGGEK